MKIKKANQPELFLFIFIVLLLLVGAIILTDFGRSTDESPEDARASVAYRIYTGDYLESPKDLYGQLPPQVQYYGTGSTVILKFVESILFPNTDHGTKVIFHYGYFIFFVASIIAIYFLANNFLDPWISLIVAVLFGTQPLFFGHAFINPKDIPMQTVFLYSVLLGLSMVDRWANHPEHDLPVSRIKQLTRAQLWFLVQIFLLSGAIWLSPLITEWAVNFVKFLYTTRETSYLGQLFSSMTAGGSLKGYMALTEIYLLKTYKWIFLAIPAILFVLFRRAQRNKVFDSFVDLRLLVASAMWGFSISTRVLAIAAGGLVGVYGLIKLRKHAVLPLAIYSITASIFSFLTWPYLWVFGLRGLLKSVFTFSDFPWTYSVLFQGQLYLPKELPASYLPKLFAIQFTEPLVILATIGAVISGFMIISKKTNIKLIMLVLWLVLPVLYVIIAKPTIYSNFRHFFFITPPIFIFAGLTLQKLKSVVRNPAWMILIGLAAILPGILSSNQYHPYQYIYYNSFVGGIAGAEGNYELDYWNLAYKDGMDYINQEAPAGSKIIVWKDNTLGEVYAQNRFYFEPHTNVPESQIRQYDYALLPLNSRRNITTIDSFPVVYTVEVDTVKLLIVSKIR